jgi:hypothetical protein
MILMEMRGLTVEQPLYLSQLPTGLLLLLEGAMVVLVVLLHLGLVVVATLGCIQLL